MAEQKSELLIEKDEPMQTDPIYFSSNEDFETHYHISGQDLTIDHDECWLNQVLIHPNDPTDVVEVTIPKVDVDKATLSHSATTESQQVKNM